jgi:hypothetical protein
MTILFKTSNGKAKENLRSISLMVRDTKIPDKLGMEGMHLIIINVIYN